MYQALAQYRLLDVEVAKIAEKSYCNRGFDGLVDPQRPRRLRQFRPLTNWTTLASLYNLLDPVEAA